MGNTSWTSLALLKLGGPWTWAVTSLWQVLEQHSRECFLFFETLFHMTSVPCLSQRFSIFLFFWYFPVLIRSPLAPSLTCVSFLIFFLWFLSPLFRDYLGLGCLVLLWALKVSRLQSSKWKALPGSAARNAPMSKRTKKCSVPWGQLETDSNPCQAACPVIGDHSSALPGQSWKAKLDAI